MITPRLTVSRLMLVAALATCAVFPRSINAQPPTAADSTSPAASAARPLAPDPNRISRVGTWSFAFAKIPADVEQLADFHRPDFASAGFAPTPVRSNWAVLGYEKPVYRGFKDDEAGQGFYLREFTPAGRFFRPPRLATLRRSLVLSRSLAQRRTPRPPRHRLHSASTARP